MDGWAWDIMGGFSLGTLEEKEVKREIIILIQNPGEGIHANLSLWVFTHQASWGRAGPEVDHHGGLSADYSVLDQFLNC